MGPLLPGEKWRVDHASCLDWLRAMPDGYLDLLFCSPPYEKARLYLENGEDMGIARDTESWVAWMVEVARESVRACKGLCAFVVEGQTRDYRWSAGPALLMADLHRAGLCLRKPPAFCRVGICGSGGPDWWRNDYEFVVCVTRGGRLPWSDNTAVGHKPRYGSGGPLSYRTLDGTRVNVTHETPKNGRTSGYTRGDTKHHKPGTLRRAITKVANPGNLICCAVGGGKMGDPLAHKNEAPFPEPLVAPFVRSFCAEGGVVGDPFSGSGTVGALAAKFGRRFAGCDIRESQCRIARKRLDNVTAGLFA